MILYGDVTRYIADFGNKHVNYIACHRAQNHRLASFFQKIGDGISTSFDRQGFAKMSTSRDETRRISASRRTLLFSARTPTAVILLTARFKLTSQRLCQFAFME